MSLRRRTDLNLLVVAFGTVAALSLIACESRETVRGNRTAPPASAVLDGPAELHEISGYLLSFRARYRVLPSELQQLTTSGAFLTSESMVSSLNEMDLDGFAYAPGGLGVLPDGRVVQLVDSQIRVPDHAWCIVREKTEQPRTAAMAVELIPLAALDAAAAAG